MEGFGGIPVFYDYENVYNAKIRPSTVHCRNTGLTWFFDRYLLQKLFAVYEFNIPESWDKDYFLYTLFIMGYVIVLNTDKFGIICQHGSLYGRNVYYRPNRAIVVNPLLIGSRDLIINEDCSLIKLAPDYRGAYDVVAMYSDMMALIMEAFGVNAINSKFAYIMAASNKAMAETFKSLYDMVASGEPAAVTDRNMFDDDGNPRWTVFQQNLKQNFIGKDLLECLKLIEAEFNTAVGIPNINTEKKARMNIDEVNANNVDTMALCTSWRRSIEESMENTNDLFGLDCSVKFTFEEQYNGNSNVNDPGTVSVR